MRYSLILLFTLSAFFSIAQTRFEKAFGGSGKNYAYGGMQTTDKGFIAVSYVRDTSTLGNDFYVVKKDSMGNTQWDKVFGGFNDDEAYGVERKEDLLNM